MIDKKLREILEDFEKHYSCSHTKCLHCQIKLRETISKIKALVIDNLGDTPKDKSGNSCNCSKCYWINQGINQHRAEMKEKFK